jgi:hypothetical protein
MSSSKPGDWKIPLFDHLKYQSQAKDTKFRKSSPSWLVRSISHHNFVCWLRSAHMTTGIQKVYEWMDDLKGNLDPLAGIFQTYTDG